MTTLLSAGEVAAMSRPIPRRISRSPNARHAALLVKEMSARAGRKWAANNKGTRNASVKARQMAKRRAMPPWLDPAEVRPFYIEAARLTQETGIPHEVDHIYPLQAADSCGLHVNIAAAMADQWGSL